MASALPTEPSPGPSYAYVWNVPSPGSGVVGSGVFETHFWLVYQEVLGPSEQTGGSSPPRHTSFKFILSVIPYKDKSTVRDP